MQNPPYFEGMTQDAGAGRRTSSSARILGAVRRLDHHRPHLAGRLDQGRRRPPASTCSSTRCEPADFNQYGTRRGNHEVMMRGTFANIRIKNQMVPRQVGGRRHRALSRRASGCRSTTRRCATRRRACRWWSSPARNTAPARRATGRPRAPSLLGVRAVIAQSLRAHPPLQPRRHGRPAARVRGRHDAGRRSASRATRRSRSAACTASSSRARRLTAEITVGRRHACERVPLHLPHRYAGRARILQERRHPALRAAQPGRLTIRRAPGARSPRSEWRVIGEPPYIHAQRGGSQG